MSALAASAATPARAEIGASASLFSDDVFRGLSLSDGRPVMNLDLSYDHPRGPYAGASGSAVATAHSGVRWLRLQEYAGYAHRLAPDLTADIGVTHADYSEYYAGHAETSYSEAYVGLISRHLSSHLYYSPRYFGFHRQTLYADLEGALEPAPNWRLTGHVGALTVVGGVLAPGAPRTRYDWRLGLAREVRGLALQLAVTGRGPDGGYAARAPRRETVVVGVTRTF